MFYCPRISRAALYLKNTSLADARQDREVILIDASQHHISGDEVYQLPEFCLSDQLISPLKPANRDSFNHQSPNIFISAVFGVFGRLNP